GFDDPRIPVLSKIAKQIPPHEACILKRIPGKQVSKQEVHRTQACLAAIPVEPLIPDEITQVPRVWQTPEAIAQRLLTIRAEKKGGRAEECRCVVQLPVGDPIPCVVPELFEFRFRARKDPVDPLLERRDEHDGSYRLRIIDLDGSNELSEGARSRAQARPARRRSDRPVEAGTPSKKSTWPVSSEYSAPTTISPSSWMRRSSSSDPWRR